MLHGYRVQALVAWISLVACIRPVAAQDSTSPCAQNKWIGTLTVRQEARINGRGTTGAGLVINFVATVELKLEHNSQAKLVYNSLEVDDHYDDYGWSSGNRYEYHYNGSVQPNVAVCRRSDGRYLVWFDTGSFAIQATNTLIFSNHDTDTGTSTFTHDGFAFHGIGDELTGPALSGNDQYPLLCDPQSLSEKN
jgi:hypothetical protein